LAEDQNIVGLVNELTLDQARDLPAEAQGQAVLVKVSQGLASGQMGLAQ
jgi:hypothetical protein